ncbi:hypothetical protein SAMN05216483_6679 [Streptomyces sp. 2131.1]|uniref:hypothetical protein n=1 Tax=Streptomyces sp. 2131.1 TaxID=1855346 RepID=UPI0008970A49|nr:hypothetical protein [Streptomyces sp. 2131.1]SEE82747.1 hypothetical protein SAMN05216483_6679 [Streptomyces sp. 2131.1]
MLIPAKPEQLAELDRALRPGAPPSFPVLLDVAEIHADTVAGRRTTQALGNYARTALPPLLRRLLAVETALVAMREKVAAHIAAYDQGDDPTALELLEDLRRAGVDLGADVEAAAAVIEAQARTATFA